MAGISDKALLKQDSKNKFNGSVELKEDYGVNLYSTFYRNYDPQIGRFGGVDGLSERSISVSSYQFGINNPVSFNDPTGALFDHVNPEGQFLHSSGDGELMFNQGSNSPGGSDRLDVVDPTQFISQLQKIIEQGYQISLADYIVSMKGNLYGSVGYYDPNNDVGGSNTLDVLLKTHYSDENGFNRDSKNGWEKAKNITEYMGLGLESMDELQRASQDAEMIEGGKALKIISKSTGKMLGIGLGIVSGISTVINAESKYGHMRTSDKADVLIDVGETIIGAIEVSSPIGWAFGIGMFVGNIISEHYTGKTITENLFNDN
jgi:RHS repeat-associated protein